MFFFIYRFPRHGRENFNCVSCLRPVSFLYFVSQGIVVKVNVDIVPCGECSRFNRHTIITTSRQVIPDPMIEKWLRTMVLGVFFRPIARNLVNYNVRMGRVVKLILPIIASCRIVIRVTFCLFGVQVIRNRVAKTRRSLFLAVPGNRSGNAFQLLTNDGGDANCLWCNLGT